jgi:hypothetical protein
VTSFLLHPPLRDRTCRNPDASLLLENIQVGSFLIGVLDQARLRIWMVRGGTDIALAFFSSSTCHIGARFDTLFGTSTIIVSPLQRTGIQLVVL